jgi:hypothetical protein
MPVKDGNLITTFTTIDSVHNVFNSPLINQMRENDNMIESLEELCKIISATMSPHIEYLGYAIIDHRVKYPQSYVSMYDSTIYCVEFNFKITGYDKKDKKTVIRQKKMVFEIPNLIDNTYYFIKGNRFYPIYQLLDATTYHKEDSVTLKTLTHPIKLTRSAYKIIDIYNKEYNAYVMFTDIQKKKVNVLVFFFANVGFFTTLKFFEGPTPIITLISEDKILKDDEVNTYFMLSKTIFLKINKEHLTGNINVRSMVATILEACPKNITIQDIPQAQHYWRYNILAHYFNKVVNDNTNAKLDLFIEQHKKLYDSITKENMRIFEDPKDNIFEVLRWMFMNFTKLLYRDNSSIFGKKIRLHDAPMALIVRRVMNKMHRVIHSRDRFKTPEKYEEILTLPYKWDIDAKNIKRLEQSSDLLTKIIANSNNTKYADGVNDMTLFNVTLKWTLNAPSTTAARSAKARSLSLSQRTQSPTFIGVIALNTSGASDPGGSGCFVPWVKLYNGFFKPNNDTEDIIL